MKILTNFLSAANGLNENPLVRFARHCLMVGLVAGVDYGTARISSVPVPPAWAWALPVAAAGLAALDKFLRNRIVTT